MAEQHKVIDTPSEIRRAYQQKEYVRGYEETRFTHPIWAMVHEKELALINRELHGCDHGRVLELAIGSARVARNLRAVGQGYGCDSSLEMLGLAKDSLEPQRWSLVQGDAFQLPFADASFDAVVSLRFIRHFRSQDRRRLFNEIRRVLGKSGTLIFEALDADMSPFAFRAAGIGRANVFEYPIYDELWSRQALTEEVEEAGYRVARWLPMLMHVELYDRLYRAATRGRIPKPRQSTFLRLLFRSLDTVAGPHPYQAIVVCRKDG